MICHAADARFVAIGIEAARHLARSGRRAVTVLAALPALAIGLVTAGYAAPPASPGAAAIEVATGVYLLRGTGGEPAPSNLGRVGSAGFIVGETGVVAIETGTSYRHGIELITAIRRVTDKPVRLALVTHARQEFVFGAAAFQQRGIQVAMQTQAATLMASRCDNCLKTLRGLLGEDALRATVVVKPDRTFATPHRLKALPDRPLELLYFGHSSGPGDIAVFDPRSGVLFSGGLVENGHIPDVLDSDLPGWHAALQQLRTPPIHAMVAAHGPACNTGCIDAVERYLTQLDSKARALLAADTPLSQVPDATTLGEFETWDQYDTIHRRNAAVVFFARRARAVVQHRKVIRCRTCSRSRSFSRSTPCAERCSALPRSAWRPSCPTHTLRSGACRATPATPTRRPNGSICAANSSATARSIPVRAASS